MFLAQQVFMPEPTAGPSWFLMFLGIFAQVLLTCLMVGVLYRIIRWFQGDRSAKSLGLLILSGGALAGTLLLGLIFATYFFSHTRTSPRASNGQTKPLSSTATAKFTRTSERVLDEGMITQIAQAAEAERFHDSSIEELHEKLTEPKIQLDEPAAREEPSKMDASEKAQESESIAVASTAEKKPGIAKPRVAAPSWVTNPPKRTGNVTRRVVSAGPYKTTSECYRQVERRLEDAVRAHLQELVRAQPALRHGYVSNLRRYNISTETILRKLCPPDGEYVEVRDTSVGEMKTLHVLMEFGPEQDAFLLKQWSDYERIERVFVLSVFAGLIFAAIALVWGLLWLDTFTRGYYTKRLFLGVPAAIIGGICLIAFIAENM